MALWSTIMTSLRNLSANGLRTTLAMLGIIIGVGSVIAMLGIGAGAQQQVLKPIVAMGKDLIVVRPAPHVGAGVVTGTKHNLTVDNAQQLLSVPQIELVAPVISQNEQVKHLNSNVNVDVIGTSMTYLLIRNFVIERGEMFNDLGVDRWQRVCILGSLTAGRLFGFSDPIGETLKIAGINFRVVGVLKSKGDQGWFNPDDQVIVPYTTAMHELFGVDWLNEVELQVKDGANFDSVEQDVSVLMRRLHKVQPSADDDVQIQNQAEIIETTKRVMGTFTLLIGSMAAICLLVGGIGIMNVMLISVRERTREIGIRKAVGARDRDIFEQFLIEGLVLSSVGGLFGVAIGVSAAWLVRAFSPFPSTVEPNSIFLALGFSTAVGVFFGLYPAIRASRLDPIEALRAE
jgi:putative ABC transport system permease protein